MNNTAGLWMLVALGLLTVATGLPVWALLLGVASAFAAAGLALGQMDVAILSALPGRITGLLEHDLLQALPLYVFVGVLMQRLQLADALFSSMARAFRGTGAGQPLAALGLGVLVAPMNGSVASSSALLARLVAPRLGQSPPARATALVAAAATVGVVVPPSLVLNLLGDAMLRAHTEASNLPGYAQAGQRTVNTQDVFHAALLPAVAILLLWLLATWWQGRRSPATVSAPLPWRRHALAAVVAAVILLLLGGVFVGKLFAVEAAASGGMLLVTAALASRALPWHVWQQVLQDTLALTGALFALLVGATTFSLVFRLWGTDRWISDMIQASPLSGHGTAALVLLAVALCAWVLDAFEMIFVVIPIVAPALVLKLGDAQQAAVLLLLVLQLSFLLPPMGYAVLMARARSGLPGVPTAALLRALAPYALLQALVIATVFSWPRAVHVLDAPPRPAQQAAPAMSEDDIVRQMQQMAPRETGDKDAPATPK